MGGVIDKKAQYKLDLRKKGVGEIGISPRTHNHLLNAGIYKIVWTLAY